MEHKYQDEINKTLEAFDGVKRAKPRPFFYGRLQAKIKASRQESVGFAMPKVAWAAGLCMLLLNVSAVIYNQNLETVSTGDQQESISSYYGWDETDSIY